MNITVSHAFVTVHDQDEALPFYRDALGLDVKVDIPFAGFRWLTLAAPSQPDFEIVLVPPGMGHSDEDRDLLASLLAKGSLNGVLIRTDKVDALFDKLLAWGAEVVQEPIDQPYGVRDCAFRDPSGNQVRIGTPTPQG